MKKIISLVLFAFVAMLAMTLTSCEKKADVNEYPFVGHTFVGSDASGTVKVAFRDNFTAVMFVQNTGAKAEYDWKSKDNNIEICLQDGIYIPLLDETFPRGYVAFSGKYDATAKTILLKAHLGSGATLELYQEQ